jgi:membrane protease YdiL (CAAX protease family)
MKKAVILVLIYAAMQMAAPFVLMPLAMLFGGMKEFTPEVAVQRLLIPSLLVSIGGMTYYLQRKGYLTAHSRLFTFISGKWLVCVALLGISTIIITDFILSLNPNLPDLMAESFGDMLKNPIGILSLAVIGPMFEELLFRGAVLGELLKRYRPATAIFLSALLFGIIHMNPVQMAGGILIGAVLGWVYWKTRSLIPCMLIHILNNSLSVFLSVRFPEATSVSSLVGTTNYYTLLGASVVLFVLCVLWLNKMPKTSL